MLTFEHINLLGIIGDIHAENELLEKSISFLRSSNVNEIVCAGDICGGYGDINKCCEILVKENVYTVSGNHDYWMLQEKNFIFNGDPDSNSDLTRLSFDYIKSLKKTMEFSTKSGIALLCHGVGDEDMRKIMPDDYGNAIESNAPLQKILKSRRYGFMINGHTHYRMVKNIDHLTIINPGTLSQEDDPSFGLLDLLNNTVTFYTFDRNYDIIKNKVINLRDIKD